LLHRPSSAGENTLFGHRSTALTVCPRRTVICNGSTYGRELLQCTLVCEIIILSCGGQRFESTSLSVIAHQTFGSRLQSCAPRSVRRAKQHFQQHFSSMPAAGINYDMSTSAIDIHTDSTWTIVTWESVPSSGHKIRGRRPVSYRSMPALRYADTTPLTQSRSSLSVRKRRMCAPQRIRSAHCAITFPQGTACGTRKGGS
jgi:hypothetical protein